MIYSSKNVVIKMLDAFSNADVDEILETVSDDSVWIYHGTQIIPKSLFNGKEGVRDFFMNIFDRTEIIHFETKQFIEEDNMVVALGREHQKVKRSGRELKQNWVQIYTVEKGLITKMEEFAASEVVEP